MTRLLYQVLNVGFFLFHSSLILFNLLGWIWRKTRPYNLLTLSLTAFSWFGLGIWYGFGFCPSTEWHWQVRMRLGYYDMPPSYIQFLVQKLTGLSVPASFLNPLVLGLFLASLGLSIGLNVRDWRQKRKKKRHIFEKED